MRTSALSASPARWSTSFITTWSLSTSRYSLYQVRIGQSLRKVREDHARRNTPECVIGITQHNCFGLLPTVHFHTDSKGRPAESTGPGNTQTREYTRQKRSQQTHQPCSPFQPSLFGICVPRQVTQFPKTVLNSSTSTALLLNIAQVSFSSGHLLYSFKQCLLLSHACEWEAVCCVSKPDTN